MKSNFLKKIEVNRNRNKTETNLQVENKLMVSKGETWRGGINQELEINKNTTLQNIDYHQGPTLHRELYSIFCDNLDEKTI